MRWERRPRIMASHDIVAAFVHATIDEVVAVLPRDGLLERDVCFLLLKGPLRHSKGFEEIRMACECSDGWDIPSSRSCGHVWMPRRRLDG